MLDIIIPVYNNAKGLSASLFSLTHIDFPFQVYIIDDYSENPNDYDNIQKFFNDDYFPTKIIHLPKNSGPGVARQIGIDNSKDEFILFLDAGDLLINFNKIYPFLLEMRNYQNIFTCSFYVIKESEFGTLQEKAEFQKLTSKIIKRSFINQYQIKFNPLSSYYYEDVGFNNIITLIAESISYSNNFLVPEYLQVYTFDINSLTNSHEKFFANIISLAENEIYSINFGEEKGLPDYLLIKAKYEALLNCFNVYWSTKNNNPEYVSYAAEPIKLIYNTYFTEEEINSSLLYVLYRWAPGNFYPFSELLKMLDNLKFDFNKKI